MAHLLECTDLTMCFGGLVALNALEMHVDAGMRPWACCPNGSGKTTFFNVVTWHLPRERGRVVVDGRDITGCLSAGSVPGGCHPHLPALQALSRFTVFDNIMVGNHTRLSLGFMHNIFRRKASSPSTAPAVKRRRKSSKP